MIKRLFIPDSHLPFVDSRAYWAMLEMAKDFKPHEIVVLGDYFDIYALSRFDKDPAKVASSLEEEILSGKELLKKTLDYLKPRKLYFLAGNHEDRITRYMKSGAPLVSALIEPMHKLFELPRNSVLIPYKSHIDFDGLIAMHGIKTGKNCASAMLDMLGKSVIFGHSHYLQMATKRLFGGEVISAYSCGWLGDYSEADYVDHANWSHGFATGLFSKGGKWSINLHMIENGKCLAFDKEYVKIPGKVKAPKK